MNAKTKTPAAAPAKAPQLVIETTVEGTKVAVYHLFRRRYGVTVGGKAAGYITSRDAMNAGGRVATVETLKALKAMLH